jgi:predicted lipoprotein with Yx(FWY)xxD motif/mono/diheme cytochrome c family protein
MGDIERRLFRMISARMTRRFKVLLVSGAALAVTVLSAACGTEKITVPKSQKTAYAGAVLFSQRCGGCHTLSYAGTHGSASNIKTRLVTNGPNFNVRCERPATRVLYAIENGGFSGATMPQNIVVGRQAQEVALFVSTYAGRKGAHGVGQAPCTSLAIGPIPLATTTPTATTAAPTSTTTTAATTGSKAKTTAGKAKKKTAKPKKKPATTPKAVAAKGPKISTATISGLGPVLVDAQGRTLYIFEPDNAKKVTCVNGCAAIWPPATLPSGEKAVASGAVKQSLLGSDTNPSGGQVITYAGWPLYTYVADTAAGAATGQAINLNGGLWYVISPSGTVIKTKPSPK